MTPSEIKDVLEKCDIQPSKSLGQNFLCDANIARWIVDQLEISAEDCVVEVGPGTGALTEHIIGKPRKLILIEFDSRLAAYHKEKHAGRDDVVVYHADGATWDIRQLFKESPVKFIGNLPYSAGGAILSNFLDRPSPVDRAVVMLQKEFIDRIIATPKDDAYGLLSLRMQMNWIPKTLKTVPPEAFHPRPRIDSTIMLLEKRPLEQFPPYNYKLMDELMRKSFAQRRKQMKKQMPDNPPWESIVSALDVPLTVRGEDLDLRQWIELTRLYDPSVKKQAQSDQEILDIVNSANQVIGQNTRKNAHNEQLMHRSVHVFVFTKKGDLILQKRSSRKDRFPNVWDSSSSGHVDTGESYAEAAIRELKEELGVDVSSTELIGTLPATENNGWEFVELHTCPTPHKAGKLSFSAVEIDAVEAFSPMEIKAWLEHRPQDFAPGFAECFHLWQKRNDSN